MMTSLPPHAYIVSGGDPQLTQNILYKQGKYFRITPVPSNAYIVQEENFPETPVPSSAYIVYHDNSQKINTLTTTLGRIVFITVGVALCAFAFYCYRKTKYPIPDIVLLGVGLVGFAFFCCGIHRRFYIDLTSPKKKPRYFTPIYIDTSHPYV